MHAFPNSVGQDLLPKRNSAERRNHAVALGACRAETNANIRGVSVKKQAPHFSARTKVICILPRPRPRAPREPLAKLSGLAAQHRVCIEPTPPAPVSPALTARCAASQRREPPSELSAAVGAALLPSLRCDRPSNLQLYPHLGVRNDHAAARKPARKRALTRCVRATLCCAGSIRDAVCLCRLARRSEWRAWCEPEESELQVRKWPVRRRLRRA